MSFVRVSQKPQLSSTIFDLVMRSYRYCNKVVQRYIHYITLYRFYKILKDKEVPEDL